MRIIDLLIDIFVYPFRMLYLMFTFWMFFWGSRKEKKWVSKNERYQDEDYVPFSKRWAYAIDKVKSLSIKLGIKVEIIGHDNLKKGAQIFVANHTSYADAIAFAYLLGDDHPSTAVGKIQLEKSKIKGYAKGLDVFFIDRNNLRQSVASLMGAGRWAKNYNRGVIIFPEGTRSKDGKLLPFSDATFSMAKKLLLPVTPVTIIGASNTLSKFFLPGQRKIKVIIDKQVKPKDIRHKDAVRFSNDVREIIKLNLNRK